MKVLIFLVLMMVVLCVNAVSHLKPTDKLATKCVGKETVITREEHKHNQDSFIDCPFNRTTVVERAKQGFDLNKDGKICADEMIKIRNHYLNREELAGIDSIESIATILYKCDCDNDGCISHADFDNTGDTCLANCNALRRLNFFIGGRIVDGKVMGEVGKPTEAISDEVLYDGKIDPELMKKRSKITANQ